ncbi:MAG: T9SS type A sorting domain-containing protein [Ignavibacteria bacterium]|nr:T9SS type A sorting domain-containing protein [Ignavibacteria bacterium]
MLSKMNSLKAYCYTRNKYFVGLFLVILTFVFVKDLNGWGSTGHSIINRKTTIYFPISMEAFKSWAEYLALHASDADYRKGSDPSEGPKHYIDIDNYSEFFAGNMPTSFDTLVARYGLTFVMDQGILPWATVTTFDSLTKAFQGKDWERAKLFAADLGHYVGDAHQPLHITRNYDGQFTNQRGIHSRYETQMINRYQGMITFLVDSVTNVSSPLDFVFNYIFNSYSYLDDVLRADSIAKAAAGNTTSEYYYSLFWDYSNTYTVELFRLASRNLASLIYSAWLKAGSPVLPASLVEDFTTVPKTFTLYQNFPNPFNYSTQIRYYIPKELSNEFVLIKVTDTLGREVTTLVSEPKSEGFQQIEFDAAFHKLTSGIYTYQIQVGSYSESKKMNYVK